MNVYWQFGFKSVMWLNHSTAGIRGTNLLVICIQSIRTISARSWLHPEDFHLLKSLLENKQLLGAGKKRSPLTKHEDSLHYVNESSPLDQVISQSNPIDTPNKVILILTSHLLNCPAQLSQQSNWRPQLDFRHCRGLSPHPHVQTGSEDSPTSHPLDTGARFPG